MRARAFAKFHGVDIRVVRRFTSIGKTPTIKELTRRLDSDVLFVLDADTLLESDTYIERVVEELYQGVGIASAWGSILPLRERDRRAADEMPAVQWFADAHPSHEPVPQKRWWRRLASGITNTYREVLYLFLQRVVFRGQMAMFGTVSNPAGCAVAYRRAYLETLFDTVEPQLGDDLTNSEDIFIGIGMLNEGYRNVQVLDVLARTVEPEVQRLPKQMYLWSSAFLQSAFYFDGLLKSPFKALKRRRIGRSAGGSGGRFDAGSCSGGVGCICGGCTRACLRAVLRDDERDDRSASNLVGGRSGAGVPGAGAAPDPGAVPAGIRQRAHAHLRPAGRVDAAGVVGGKDRVSRPWCC